MKKLLTNNLFIFITWRILITLIAISAILYIPVFSENFFGGKYLNYVKSPLLWSFANFDGEHYMSIAQNGYRSLQQAFFPFYPLVIRFFAFTGSEINLKPYLLSGIFVSNLAFLVSIYIFKETAELDYDKDTSTLAIFLLLFFPTSFFFGNVYTESLFLALSLLTYYFYRKEKYLLSGIFGFLLTATRLYGIFVILTIVVDIILKKEWFKSFVNGKKYLVFISPLGLLSYMYYSFIRWGDAFAFYNLQTLSGEQRSENIILLPQVFYRYFVKIIPNLNFNYFPLTFTTLFEFITAIIFLLIIIFSFKKIRWDYWVYILLGFVTPTLTGSFSSPPRYVLILFPAFFYVASILKNKNKYLKYAILLIMLLIGIIAQSLFVRGYFVS